MNGPFGPGPVRRYVTTAGRTEPTRSLWVTTLLRVADAAQELPPTATGEARALLELCAGGQLSLAKAAAHLRLPVTLAAVIASDLIDSGHLVWLAEPRTDAPDTALLEEVLRGLRALR